MSCCTGFHLFFLSFYRLLLPFKLSSSCVCACFPPRFPVSRVEKRPAHSLYSSDLDELSSFGMRRCRQHAKNEHETDRGVVRCSHVIMTTPGVPFSFGRCLRCGCRRRNSDCAFWSCPGLNFFKTVGYFNFK